jgi:hypothetical protein
MKPLYTARNIAEAHLIRGYLESEGIDAIVRGEYLLGAMGDLPGDLCRVYVINDGEFVRADLLLRQFLQGELASEHAHAGWRCASCNEAIEGQFTACWNCGASRGDHLTPA